MDRGHYNATINAAEHIRPTRTYFKARSGLIGSSLLALAFALFGSGCAVKQDANKRTVYSLDHAAVLGTERARFKLADGSEGSLRSMGDEYSLKLEKFYKVIPLGKARQMQMQPAYQINGRTVLVINLQNTSGCVKTAVLSIQGSQVLNWLITPSDCKSVPTLAANDQQLQLSYSGSRYLYENGRLVEEKPVEVAAPPPQPGNDPVRNTHRDNARDNARAETPARSARSATRVPAAQTTPTSTSAPAAARQTSRTSPQNAATSTAPPELRFSRSAEEQKPVIINLE